jgi:large subunit ribosomal protein L25
VSELVSLVIQPRTSTGSRASKRVRAQGLIPGVIYGHKEAVVNVSIPAKELDHAIRVKHARTLEISLDGKKETVLIRELQWDYLGKEMVHIDLWRVSKDEKVKVTVPVELKGLPKISGGAVLDQPMHALHIECLATAIPDAIKVDISALTLGAPIHIRELKLPDGVTVLENPELVVVHLKVPGAEPEPTAAVEGAAEPEVLTAKKPKDGDEE